MNLFFLLVLAVLVCLVVGFITVLKWIFATFMSSQDTGTSRDFPEILNRPASPPKPEIKRLFDIEYLKTHVVRLVQDNQLSAEGMAGILRRAR